VSDHAPGCEYEELRTQLDAALQEMTVLAEKSRALVGRLRELQSAAKQLEQKLETGTQG
jgi:vacuolar-type H+-ATPase subunit D/Vma8